MDRLAKQQTCQLFIEEEIDKGIKAGLPPKEIKKGIIENILKYFQVKLNPESVRRKITRAKQTGTNVPPELTPQNDSDNFNLEKLEKTSHGGAREGAGRKLKRIRITPSTMGINIAELVIMRLQEIPDDDKELIKGLLLVKEWIDNKLKEVQYYGAEA